jgi:hypothetical protein
MASRPTASAILGAAVLLGLVLAVPQPVYTHKPITTNILFKNEIAQIFQRKCFQCHSDNNLSMSLTTYTDARPWARAIREEVLERKMPPWQAVQGYGHFANDISLNTREKEIILSWADGGAPSGVLKAEESIAPVFVAPAPEWSEGPPDQVLAIGAGQLIAGGAPFQLKRFVVATKLSSARRVRAIALKQGDRRVVRHAAFYEEATGRWLGAWTPWQTSSRLPAKVAVSLPANARIAVEIGYSGAESDVTDKSELGLYFENATGAVADAISLAAPEATLAAGAASHKTRVEMKLAKAMMLVALWPDPSAGASSVEITATTPDGMMTPLLWIQEYRPEWRSPYYLAAPVTLPVGSRLVMTTYFDNPGDKPVVARAAAKILTAPTTEASSKTAKPASPKPVVRTPKKPGF